MNTAVKRLALLPLLAVALACPGDKKNTAALPVDTAKPDTAKLASADTAGTDLSKIKTNLPAAAPDTFHPQKLTPANARGGNVGSSGHTSFADAPTPLVDAVEREQSATRFCYTEFGQRLIRRFAATSRWSSRLGAPASPTRPWAIPSGREMLDAL